MTNNNQIAVELLLSKIKIYGIGHTKVIDGDVYMFTKTKLLELLKEFENNKSEEIIVFVKDKPKDKENN